MFRFRGRIISSPYGVKKVEKEKEKKEKIITDRLKDDR